MFRGLDTTQFISRDYYETSSSISKIGLIFYLRGGVRNTRYIRKMIYYEGSEWTSTKENLHDFP